MKAIEKLDPLQGVQILKKNICIPIKDGETVLGEIVFNPDDTNLYKRFIALIENLHKGDKAIKGIDLSGLDFQLETLEDFEKAQSVFDKANEALNVSDEVIDTTCADLNKMFGADKDICAVFMQGSRDMALLEPLFDVVIPYFRKSRQSKVSKYATK